MKRRLISLEDYMNESKIADRIMDLIELAQSNTNDVKVFVELTTAIGLNPKNLKNIKKVKDIIVNNDDSLDAMNFLMDLTESDNVDEGKHYNMEQRFKTLDEYINEMNETNKRKTISWHDIKHGDTVEYIIPGTKNETSYGIVQSKNSTRTEDYLIVLDNETSKTVNVFMDHVASVV